MGKVARDRDGYTIMRSWAESDIWERSSPLLSRLDVELTERCNNNCSHCFINLPASDLARARELPTAEVKEAIKEASTLGCLVVRFTGGEPILREDFEEIYLYTRSLGMRVILFTNATLIDPPTAELLARVPPMERVEVTVYGMGRASYEAVTRNPGSFEAAFHGMSLLRKYGVPFVVKGTVHPSNMEDWEDLEVWGANELLGTSGSPARTLFLDLRARRDPEKNFLEKNALIKKLRISPEEGVRLLTRREGYIDDIRVFCGKFMGPRGDRLFSCGSGVGRCCLDAYGYLQPCLTLKHPDASYDLRGGSLRDAMANFFPRLRETRATNPEYLSRCALCFLKGLCEQCPAKSWMEHGTLDTPVEYLCDVAHHQARHLGLLEDGEAAWEVPNWRVRLRRFSEGANV